jgi:hypothetical protein
MIGCEAPILHNRIQKHEIKWGMQAGVTNAERERIKALERENIEPSVYSLRQRTRRNHQRPLQNRTDPTAITLKTVESLELATLA